MSDSPRTDAASLRALSALKSEPRIEDCVSLALACLKAESTNIEQDLTAARAQLAALTAERDDYKAHFEAADAQMGRVITERNNLRAQVADLTDERDKLREDYNDLRAQLDRIPADLFAASGIIVGLREDLASSRHRALTVMALRIRHEVFFVGAGIGEKEFTRTYLSSLGDYERKVAKEEDIPID